MITEGAGRVDALMSAMFDQVEATKRGIPMQVPLEQMEELARQLARELDAANAALSAMTAERDRHMAAVAAYNEDCKACEAELANLMHDMERLFATNQVLLEENVRLYKIIEAQGNSLAKGERIVRT